MSLDARIPLIPNRNDRAPYETALIQCIEKCTALDNSVTAPEYIESVHAYYNLCLNDLKTGVQFRLERNIFADAQNLTPSTERFITAHQRTAYFDTQVLRLEWEDCHLVFGRLNEELAKRGILVILGSGPIEREHSMDLRAKK